MLRWQTFGKLVIFVLLTYIVITLLSAFVDNRETNAGKDAVENNQEDTINFEEADNITGFSRFVVPNIIHMVHFGSRELNFGEMLAIKSAHLNQQPEHIFIHCDCYNMTGKYWESVKDIPGLEVRYKEKRTEIFGKKFSYIQHASDVARLEVLMAYGGIYLDSDMYVVKSFDPYRKFEIAIGWDIGQFIGNQVIVAHKDARFLKLYYETYRDYRSDLWYYNGGELPTTSILYKQPQLVHRVVRDFGVDMLVGMLYKKRTDEWKTFTSIHLLLRHKSYLVKEDPIKEFDEINVKTYNRTFGDMARLVLYGTTELITN